MNNSTESTYREAVETTNTLKHALSIAHRTNEIGISTANELNDQGLQMDGMEINLDRIYNNNSMAERHLRSIKSALGTFVNFFSRSVPTIEVPKPTIEKPQSSFTSSPTKLNTNTDTLPNNEITTDYKYLNDASLEYELIEQDKDLDELYSVINNLNGIAQNMNLELDTQNAKLKKIANRVDKQNDTIQYTTGEINKILRQ
jgi:hypothetical protein